MKARYVAIPAVDLWGKLLPFIGVAFVIFTWWLIKATDIVSSPFVPTPWATLKELAAMFHDGIERHGDSAVLDSTVIVDGWASVRRVLYAVFFAAVIGIPIGILMGTFGRVEALLKWVVFPFRTAPIIAFIPIFFLIWGLTDKMKIGFLFFGTVVYMIPLTYDAIRAVPEEYVDAAVDYGFTPFGTIWHFLIPAAWPRIFEGIKVCVGIAWTYLVAAEIANVSTGLGRVIKTAERFQNTERVWAGLILILAIGVVTDQILGLIRRKYFNWEV